MVDGSGKNLVFLLCVPRSGSSLATVMLQNHSKVFATQEMWFLMSLYDLRFGEARPYGGKAIIDQFYNGVLTDELFEQACRSFALQVYNGLLSSGSAEIVVDKSPRYYYLLEFLDRLFPQSRRIWLIRNPLSIAASYKKVNHRVKDRFNLAEDLISSKFNIKMTDLTAGLIRYYHYFSDPNALTHRLYYERLVSNPNGELSKLCEFLGLAYEEGMESYGDQMDSAKSDMFYSMGVGDPFLVNHKEPHRKSIDSWKEVLHPEEVEAYCRVLGSGIFHDLGYGEELAEAERLTGAKFDKKPDPEVIGFRQRQLTEAAGVKWEPFYRLRTDGMYIGSKQTDASSALPSGNAEMLQLQMTLRAVEKRLEKGYAEQERLRNELQRMKSKLDRFKSIIPFGHRLTHWASVYLNQRGGTK